MHAINANATSTNQDEVIIDQRSWKEKALNMKKVAASHIKNGLAATVRGVGFSARWLARHMALIILGVFILAAIGLILALNVWFLMWLYSVSQVAFWIVLILWIIQLMGTVITGISQLFS